MSRFIRIPSAILALGFSVGGSGYAASQQSIQPQNSESVPNTIVVQVEVTQQGEQNPLIYLVNSQTRITNGDEAQSLNMQAQQVQPINLVQNQLETECPEQLQSLLQIMSTVDSPEGPEDSNPYWRFGIRSPYGNTGFFYGYGRGSHYGYHPRSRGYHQPNYGFHFGANYRPYYGSNYFHRNGNHRYYYYHSPYYRW